MYKMHHNFKDKLDLDTFLIKVQMERDELLDACKEAQNFIIDSREQTEEQENIIHILQLAINKAGRAGQ